MMENLDVTIPEQDAIEFAIHLRKIFAQVGVDQFEKTHPLRRLEQALVGPGMAMVDADMPYSGQK